MLLFWLHLPKPKYQTLIYIDGAVGAEDSIITPTYPDFDFLYCSGDLAVYNSAAPDGEFIYCNQTVLSVNLRSTDGTFEYCSQDLSLL